MGRLRPAPDPDPAERLRRLAPHWSPAHIDAALRRLSVLLGGGARGLGLASGALQQVARRPRTDRLSGPQLAALDDVALMTLPEVQQVLEQSRRGRADAGPHHGADVGGRAQQRAAALDQHPEGERVRTAARAALAASHVPVTPGRVDLEAWLLLHDRSVS